MTTTVGRTDQDAAIATFSAMLEAAFHYRATGERGILSPNYGICDNIDYFTPSWADGNKMARVKDNVIRRIPSFSGAYHYPVKGPILMTPGEAWESHRDKWFGDYGFNRITQLQELVDFIRSNWDDSLTMRRTPAERMGWKIGDVGIHKTNSKAYRFVQDDDTSSPYFEELGSGNKLFVELSDLERRPPLEKRSVAAYVKQAKKLVDAKAKLEENIRQMQQALAVLEFDIAQIDCALAEHHGVKRI